MGYRYAVLGAGRQGCAAACDFARHGEAEDILILDSDESAAAGAAFRVNALAGRAVARSARLDVADVAALSSALEGRQATLSAVPYRFNLAATRAAIAAGSSFNDLGGNTDIVRQQLLLDEAARLQGVSVVPDCGLAPGLANVLAAAGIRRMDAPKSVRMWCGGLPRNRDLPFGYKLLFSPGGLTNEYSGDAVLLRDGRIALAPALTEPEAIEFPQPVGPCEAFLTSGGTSTCPWSFEGTLETFEYKTVRYPGHLVSVRALADLGFLEEEPVLAGGVMVAPREFLHAQLVRKLSFPDEPDLVVLRVRVAGRKGDRTLAIVFDLLDHSDPATGYSAMERCTGYPAAAVSWMQARGEVPSGAQPQELSVPAERLIEEVRRRGLAVRETIESGGS